MEDIKKAISEMNDQEKLELFKYMIDEMDINIITYCGEYDMVSSDMVGGASSNEIECYSLSDTAVVIRTDIMVGIMVG